MNVLLKKYKIDNLYSKEEIEEKEREYIKKQKAIERCHMMYERGKIKNEIIKRLIDKNEEMKLKKEISECTWKPKTNEKIKKGGENSRIYNNKNIQYIERIVNWKKNKDKKIERSRSQLNIDYTFKPELNSYNPQEVFNNEGNMSRSETKYIYRMNRARNEEEEKKSKLGSVRNDMF